VSSENAPCFSAEVNIRLSMMTAPVVAIKLADGLPGLCRAGHHPLVQPIEVALGRGDEPVDRNRHPRDDLACLRGHAVKRVGRRGSPQRPRKPEFRGAGETGTAATTARCQSDYRISDRRPRRTTDVSGLDATEHEGRSSQH
jgi:hypothetical protein